MGDNPEVTSSETAECRIPGFAALFFTAQALGEVINALAPPDAPERVETAELRAQLAIWIQTRLDLDTGYLAYGDPPSPD